MESDISDVNTNWFCGHWCEDVSRQYLAMNKEKSGIMNGWVLLSLRSREESISTEEIKIFFFLQKRENFTVRMLLEDGAMWD